MVSDGAESAAGKPDVSELAEVETKDITWRPRWRFLGLFAVLVAIHLAGGWTSTATIGLPLGFACTLVLMFVRRLPPWLTGEWSPRPALPVRVDQRELVDGDTRASHVAGTVTFPDGPHGPGPFSRAALGRHLRLRTFALSTVVVLGVAMEITVFATSDGVLPWVLLAPVLLAVIAAVNWRSDVAFPARLLAAGPWTEVAAAVVAEDVRPGRPVSGWALFPDQIRVRFHVGNCPPDVIAELLGRRRLWIAGEPRAGEAAIGIPDGDTFAIAAFAVKQREYRRAKAR